MLTSKLIGLWHHHSLIVQLARREVVGRYKGSIFGVAWSFLNPVFMLIVYTFVYSVVFKSQWTGVGVSQTETRTEFALILFVGIIIHTLISEVFNRAPLLIINNQNYVKRVVFPLEILPVVSVISAVFHATVSLLVMLLAFGAINGYFQWTVVYAPLVILPFVVLTLGFAWVLASLGVYLRDLGQFIGLLTTALMFLAPVFYPLSALPSEFRPWIIANPLTFIIEQMREVLIWGHAPDWAGLLVYSLVSLATAWCGLAWFQRTKKGFADVL